MPTTQILLPDHKQQKPIKHTPRSFERANWRVNDFLAYFAIGRTKFYERVKAGDVKIVKCDRTTLIPHSDDLPPRTIPAFKLDSFPLGRPDRARAHV